jgi:hypothetical protein
MLMRNENSVNVLKGKAPLSKALIQVLKGQTAVDQKSTRSSARRHFK